MPAGQDRDIRPVQRAWLAHGLALAAIGLLVGCVYRLIWLERHRAEGLRDQAQSQQRSTARYLARRGSILDSHPNRPEQHTTLAVSYLLDSVFIDPKLVRKCDREKILEVLGRELNLAESRRRELLAELIEADSVRPGHLRAASAAYDALCRSISGRPGPDPPLASLRQPTSRPDAEAPTPPADGVRRTDPTRFIYVKRLVSQDESERVRRCLADKDLGRRLRGVGLTAELKREYPGGQLAAHQIGFVGGFGEALEGLEKRFDARLAGLDGRKTAVTDARRRPIWSGEEDYVPPRDGLTMVLNINAVVQAHTEQVLAETVREYKAESGVAVVMDPRTGALLAVASEPTFPLDQFNTARRDHMRNRALTDPFEPGSIFKWAVLAGAIDRGVVRPRDTFDCHGGRWNHNGRIIRDVHGYGLLTAREIQVKSSNIGMSQIGLKMGRQALYDCLADFGFGRKTGIELDRVEDAGLLYPVQRWTSYSVPSVSFGQEVMVTPIQMVTAFSALANGGYLLRPRLVQAFVDDSTVALGGTARVAEDCSRPVVRRRVISEATARTMVDILTEVVEKGTGQKARIEGLKVFGKTGTAQIGQGGVYLSGQYTSSFIGGAPSEAPRVVVLVAIRKPDTDIGYYGGTVAAPAVRQIIEKTLAFLQS